MDEYMEWIHSTWNPPGMWGQGKLLHFSAMICLLYVYLPYNCDEKYILVSSHRVLHYSNQTFLQKNSVLFF